jgi:tetratricopeptide (TPR) repeat protein
MQKTIKIALASSSELKSDREQFEIFIARKNKILAKQGINLELVIWEDFIDAMSHTRLQDEYNKAMQEAHIFVMLFFTKVGKYTLEEFGKVFDHFQEHGRPLIYTYCKTASINTDSLDEQDVLSLFAFKKRLAALKHFTSKYSDISDLKYEFSEQLEKVLPQLIQQLVSEGATDPAIPDKAKKTEALTQKTDLYHLPKPTTKLVGRTKELEKIEAAFNDYNTHIFAIIAAGGIGKSALIDEWLGQLKTKNLKLKTIFGWSFYSQGSHDTQTSSTQFFEQALPFWDYDLKSNPLTDDTAKGRKLAELLRSRPSLLILDGLEPLQNKDFVDGGRLKDQGLAALLRDVERNGLGNNSLIIISSRQPLKEPENSPHYQSLDLQSLSSSDGVKLLRSLNVDGLQNELETAEQAYGGHALALVLLGRLLVKFFKADVNQHVKLSELLKSPHTKGKEEVSHAERVMNFYNEHWSDNAPERCFLNLLGLFDRPMGKGEKDALLEKAEIAKPLAALSELDWQAMLNNLQDMSLLLEKNENSYDTHPLIRTYFGEQFQKQNPSDWKQAHLILFEYFQTVPEKHHPDTLEDLEPLYRAVVHGCLAGEYQKALDDVFRERIDRQNGYSVHKIGAYAQNLAAIAACFPEGWNKPVSQGLSEAAQGGLLAVASFCLMSLGRLSEAVKPRWATLKLREKLKDWKNAGITAENLVDLLAPLGRLTEAKDAAEKAIVFADRANDKLGDKFGQMTSRSYLATILHRQGDLDAALKEFKQAEEIQKERQPEYPKLYSLRGAQYCALLLDLAKDRAAQEEVLERGQYALELAEKYLALLDIAFDHLTIARALFSLNRFDESKEEFGQAVAGGHKAGRIDHLPVFLLERGKFLCHQKDFEQSQADLDEAKEIIERCGMKLYKTDAALLQAKLNLEQNKEAQL